MDFKLEFINPFNIPHWNRDILSFPGATIFHSVEWARTLAEAYRYEPHYAVWRETEHPVCVLPVMEIKSFLTRTRGVSLPFTDMCHPLNSGQISNAVIKEELVRYGKTRGWRSIEIRGIETPGDDGNGPPSYLVHELDLQQGEEHLLKQARSSTRRNIRKAAKNGVEIVEDNSRKGLASFCRLNNLTRREHGLPPQPDHFFQCLHRYLLEPGMGRILLAIFEGNVVAAAIFLTFNRQVIYKYGASDSRFNNLRPNNLLMWEAIRSSSLKGETSFHFGRTEPRHEGLQQFKRGWGSTENKLHYELYKRGQGYWNILYPSTDGFHTRIFSRTPVFALRLVGKALYRHIG